MDIDPDAFTQNGIFEQYIGIGSECAYETAEKPHYDLEQFTDKTGAVILIDQQNRFRRFTASSDAKDKTIPKNERLTEEQLLEEANAILKVLAAHSNFTLDSDATTVDDANAKFTFRYKISERLEDLAVVTFTRDGTVQSVGIDYCDVPAEFDPAAADAAFWDYLDQKVAQIESEPIVQKDTLTSYFTAIDGTIYGAYTIDLAFPGPESDPDYSYEVVGVIVRAT